MPKTEKTAIEKMTYEQAFAELDEIIRSLEDNPPALEETLTLYERGQALAQRCTSLLDAAELKVRQLSGDELAAGTDE